MILAGQRPGQMAHQRVPGDRRTSEGSHPATAASGSGAAGREGWGRLVQVAVLVAPALQRGEARLGAGPVERPEQHLALVMGDQEVAGAEPSTAT